VPAIHADELAPAPGEVPWLATSIVPAIDSVEIESKTSGREPVPRSVRPLSIWIAVAETTQYAAAAALVVAAHEELVASVEIV
jgi:hypothetical protein